MLVPVIFAALLLGVQSPRSGRARLPGTDVAAGPVVDSARVVREAHRAQEQFELLRRANLPRETGGGSHPCDVVIGRWCRWDDGDDEREPPPESPRVVSARRALLAALASASAALPGDRWIAGQRVRYLIEDDRAAAAESVAVDCAARPALAAWCGMLAGSAAHARAHFDDADAHFSAALAAMPDSERCATTDLGLLLDDDAAARYDRASCAERLALDARIELLGAPLYLRSAKELRTELLARRIALALETDARSQFGSARDPGLREMRLRYGGGHWYSREDPPPGSLREASIVSHDRAGLDFNPLPSSRALIDPRTLTDDDWDFRRRNSRTRYAPAGLRRMGRLERLQLARFDRPDSTVFIAAYDADGDTTIGARTLVAGLFVAPLEGDTIDAPGGLRLEGASRRGALRLAYREVASAIVSVELLDSTRAAALRSRTASLAHPPSALRISDIIVLAPSEAAARDDRALLARALPGAQARRDEGFALYWETYGVAESAATLDLALRVERLDDGVLPRVARALHLRARDAGVIMHWTERAAVANAIPREVTLAPGRLGAGRYRVTLAVAADGRPPATATRVLELTR